jgi:acyl-coenzyme A synthetase/AMP-(fatty) acid ligase
MEGGAKVVITANESVRGGKSIFLKKFVDEAVKDCPSVKAVLVEQRSENEAPVSPLDVRLSDVLHHLRQQFKQNLNFNQLCHALDRLK